MNESAVDPAIVVAGHICLDLIPRLMGPTVDVTPGHLMHLGPATLSLGGAVANTGIALHRLGVPVQLIAKVGEDAFGQIILDTLNALRRGLASGIIIAPGEATSYSIVINPPGRDRSFWHCPGTNDTFAPADALARIAAARIFHFGYPPLMRRLYIDGGIGFAKLLDEVRNIGLVTSVDLSQPDPQSEAGRVDWPAFFQRTLPFIDLFLPSFDELLYMMRGPAALEAIANQNPAAALDGRVVRDLAAACIDRGAGVIAIKLGLHGLYVRCTSNEGRFARCAARLGLDPAQWLGREVYSPCFAVQNVAGTTGSGDCTIGGFLAALLRAETIAGTATAATAVGAFSVEAADATSAIQPWPEVQKRLSAGWPRLNMPIDFGQDVIRTTDAQGIEHLHEEDKS